MSNMAHCRFRNTLPDLYDCYDAMGDDDLSAEESAARTDLVALARLIVENYGDDYDPQD